MWVVDHVGEMTIFLSVSPHLMNYSVFFLLFFLGRISFSLVLSQITRTRSSQGVTPLNVAAQEGHLEVVQFLVGARADVNKANNDVCVSSVRWCGCLNYIVW